MHGAIFSLFNSVRRFLMHWSFSMITVIIIRIDVVAVSCSCSTTIYKCHGVDKSVNVLSFLIAIFFVLFRIYCVLVFQKLHKCPNSADLIYIKLSFKRNWTVNSIHTYAARFWNKKLSKITCKTTPVEKIHTIPLLIGLRPIMFTNNFSILP